MAYQALARKWRPHRFDQIAGQSHIIRILSNALNKNKLHHAYLFTGTHGVGKTTFARIFAKCLNCASGITATPCDQCTACIETNAGRFPDLYEIDAASRTKVEDTRELLNNIVYAPIQGRYKIYLIDEVHMLSGHSFNALLKTLEEPPEHIKFLLATTDPQKLPATVLSRCLQFHLSKLTTDEIQTQIENILTAEKIAFEKSALSLLSASAEGSMRDALSLLDQCIAYCHADITEKDTRIMLGMSAHTEIEALLSAIIDCQAQSALSIVNMWLKNGVNFINTLSQLVSILHHVAVNQFAPNTFPEYENFAKLLSKEEVHLYYQIALMGQKDILLSPSAQLGFEMIVLRMMAFGPIEKTDQNHVNWRDLLQSLVLTGPALTLAQQCTLKCMSDHICELSLDPKYKALLNLTQQNKIEDSLNKVLNKQLKLSIIIEESNAETPAKSMKRLQEAKIESAKEAISTDPIIQTAIQAFDAKIVDNSVESLKN